MVILLAIHMIVIMAVYVSNVLPIKIVQMIKLVQHTIIVMIHASMAVVRMLFVFHILIMLIANAYLVLLENLMESVVRWFDYVIQILAMKWLIVMIHLDR